MKIRSIVILFLLVFTLACEKPTDTGDEPSAENAMVAKIPGTDFEGCDADCKWVKRANNTYKCVADTCAAPCFCRVLSRPRKNWDGDWDDEGEWEDAQERENDKFYRCWCVK